MFRSFVKDPLVIFLGLGLAIFALSEYRSGVSRNTVLLDSAVQSGLDERWRSNMDREPTEEERTALQDQWIKEEILYREALALELDRDDQVIRRRLIQKVQSLNQALVTSKPATEEDLVAFYQAHPHLFMTHTSYSFRHAFFSDERRSDAEMDALNAKPASDLGNRVVSDPFILQTSYADLSAREMENIFGASFLEAVDQLPSNCLSGDHWCGPIQSSFGWHLIELEQVSEAGLASFDIAIEQVRSAYFKSQIELANERLYQELQGTYMVKIE